ncbi:hypothetical protein [Brevifollis gellanilyticus]|uniref:Uncharacterized protein n=1 Tax=Brevifollis gellanilyticus TaxID=748831 RepID=A0A512M3M3_9BACT|nr:hypothetical protein [Brevifollis gellanilyticus]GEP40921.1 hypothetical protein BGE01nite_02120 [Brevifollis gellanilyticus]
MAKNTVYSLEQLKRAVEIHEQIEKLQVELDTLLGQGGGARRGRKPGAKASTNGSDAVKSRAAKKKVKRAMSPEAREKIAQAQKKRWAKTKKVAS